VENNETRFISFANVIKKAAVVITGDGFIEVPGSVVFVNSVRKHIIHRLISPTSTIVRISAEKMAEYQGRVGIHNPGIIFLSRRGPMKETVRLNIFSIKYEITRFVEIGDTVILVDNYAFSSSVLDWKGYGLFGGFGRKSFLLNRGELERIRTIGDLLWDKVEDE